MNLRVELKALNKHFGEVTALRQLTERIEPGDKISIIGHNGAGKSTLLSLVATIARPSSGEVVFYDGARTLDQKADIRGRLSLLSHAPMMYPDLTALENLAFTNRLYGLNHDREALFGFLAQVGMGHAADRLFRTCSRGMQQRLSLARALLLNPELILLDEPFTGLDREGVARIKGVFEKLSCSMLMVTHHLTLGYELANRFWMMKRGRITHSLKKADIGFEEYLKLCQVEISGEAGR